MKRSSLIPHHRAFLLPVIMTVSFLLVFLGMKGPSVPNPVKPKLHNRAVVETQLKSAKTDQTKAPNISCPAELCQQPEIVAPTTIATPLLACAYHAEHLTVIAQLPSRAPPVSVQA